MRDLLADETHFQEALGDENVIRCALFESPDSIVKGRLLPFRAWRKVWEVVYLGWLAIANGWMTTKQVKVGIALLDSRATAPTIDQRITLGRGTEIFTSRVG